MASGELKRLRTRLYRQMKSCAETYELFAPGDHVMVAISGGKDSYALLDLIGQLASRVPFSLSYTAIHLDQKQPGYDGEALRGWLEAEGHPFEILGEDTYSIVKEQVAEGGTYCSLCSRLRRGILYTTAERLGCNKIALGHHRDDSLQTLLMNMMFNGRLQAMPVNYTTDDGRFEVIRPLMFCAEEDIAAFASERAFPIIPCNLCGSQDGLKRQEMKTLLATLEKSNPNVRSTMLRALSRVHPTHLLDQDLKRAWAQRPTDISEKPGLAGAHTQQHANAPEHASTRTKPQKKKRLPLVSPQP